MSTRWRDCKGWMDSNLPMTSSSDEACKFFDAAIIQMTSLYEDSELGGTGNTLKQMMEADPDFVMGQVLVNTLKYACSQCDREAVTKALDGISNLALKQEVTDRERKHVTALKLVTEGKTLQAVETYREILTDSPTDLMACLFAYFKYYELGMSKEMLDIMKFVVEAYSSETPGYSTILAWKAFAHEENSQLVEAEQESYKSLAVSSGEAFAIHTMAHIHLERGMLDVGLAFLQSKAKYWESSNLACHIAWHEALFLLEKGQFDDAVKIFDEQIITRAATGGNFNDASSLLYRLSFEDVQVPQRWKSVLGLVDKFYEQHRWIYIDAHILFTLYRNGEKERASEMLEKLKSFVKDTTGANALVTHDVGIPLCAGITAFEEGHYETATNCLNSIRTTLHKIGGSIAQRDTFVQLLIHSAIKSPNPDHRTLARTILNERKTKRADDPLGDRLISLLENNASD
ncbi:tetratricopeptide repeat protein 38-like isoform X2 [Ostrea edulis]|uniref:tetratricopeptide repeat protein 38-like isoform X2 n=1 Tax=Ostrea edulis TaxID=37623 RepID=UPI002095A9ED|nr:tetratricopeptide repeat protein 38-like isoform X2 [Ostrea edulis]